MARRLFWACLFICSAVTCLTCGEICPEVRANEIHALYDRHNKVSPSPNPHHKASNSVKHEDIWKSQLIVCNMKYPRSQLCAL